MNPLNQELEFWSGQGGDSYMRRNQTTGVDLDRRKSSWAKLLPLMTFDSPPHVLEVGPGPGANLSILHELMPLANLYAVEPNESARNRIKQSMRFANIQDGHAANILAADGSFDFVFTAGVLIHVHPDRLKDALVELIRVSRRYVLAVEYFAPTAEPVFYYGADRIWRNDFGREYLELGLKHIAHGFFWAETDGFDSTVYWLLEKP